jgi:hypothetical protein
VAAWPAVALVGSYELLMLVFRGSQAAPGGISSSADNPDPLGARAAEIFAEDLAVSRTPSIRSVVVVELGQRNIALCVAVRP